MIGESCESDIPSFRPRLPLCGAIMNKIAPILSDEIKVARSQYGKVSAYTVKDTHVPLTDKARRR